MLASSPWDIIPKVMTAVRTIYDGTCGKSVSNSCRIILLNKLYLGFAPVIRLKFPFFPRPNFIFLTCHTWLHEWIHWCKTPQRIPVMFKNMNTRVIVKNQNKLWWTCKSNYTCLWAEKSRRTFVEVCTRNRVRPKITCTKLHIRYLISKSSLVDVWLCLFDNRISISITCSRYIYSQLQ